MASVGTSARDEIAGISRKLAEAVISISKEYDREDRDERNTRKPLWLKLENYFEGLQRRYWDSVARDWRILPEDDKNETSRHYDKIINIYRAHAESIIAALSGKLPSAIFYPEDADVTEDVDTAKACIKIKKLIERHNSAQLLLIKCLLILFNTGVIAGYCYNKKSSIFGTYKKPIYGKEPISIITVNLNCAECGSNIDEIIFKGERGKITEESKKCEVCGYNGTPIEEEYNEQIPEIISYSNESKFQTRIEVFSPLYVQIPLYARKQENIPYLRLKFEQHYAMLKETFPKLAKKGNLPTRADQDSEDRQISLSARNLATVECLWVRPWAYNIHETPEDIKELKKRYPDGFYAIIIDDTLIEITNESLDDHWHISENPLGELLHSSPLGKPVAPIQDLKNEVVDLQIETFEHAIPETFARGDVVDFKKYKESQAAPGMMYPVMAPGDGQSLGDSFHTVKTATLSEETDIFNKRLDNEAQFVLGSFPSIYGGPATSGSKTAREYEQSRAMALQRLGTIWKLVQNFWAPFIGKGVQIFIHELRKQGQDERFVDKDKNVGFINIWIKQTEIEGKVGRVEADVEEDLPQSANQLKDIAIQLLNLNNENINEVLFHPMNAPFVNKVLGAPEFFMPDSDSRDKQYAEFSELIQGIPIQVNLEVDDHIIEAEVCLTFLRSASGRNLPEEAKQAIIEHKLQHDNAQMEKLKQDMLKQEMLKPQPAPPAAEGTV